MNAEWFKRLHRLTGVSQQELARRLGKGPPFLTRVYSGAQPLRLHEAEQIAAIMDAPLADVLYHAGLSAARQQDVDRAARAHSEVREAAHALRADDAPASVRPQGPNESVWAVDRDDLRLAGYRQGDHVLVDAGAPPRRGDAVLAQVYDNAVGSARTGLYIYEPPYLVLASVDTSRPLLVDGEKVVIRGVVTRQWRINR